MVNILEIAFPHFDECCPLLVLKVALQLLLLACYKVCLHPVHLFIHGFIKTHTYYEKSTCGKALVSKNMVQNIVLFDFIAWSLHL